MCQYTRWMHYLYTTKEKAVIVGAMTLIRVEIRLVVS
jgi:hypothetical protein